MDKESVEAIARCSRTFASCAASVGQVGSHLARLAAVLDVAIHKDDIWGAYDAVNEIKAMLLFCLEVDYDLLVESKEGLNASLAKFDIRTEARRTNDSLAEA